MVLLGQWYHAALSSYDYMTLPTRGEDGGLVLQAFQVLDVERRNLIVRPFLNVGEACDVKGLYTIAWQPLEVWGCANTSVGTLETFSLEEPSKIDILTACGVTLESGLQVCVCGRPGKAMSPGVSSSATSCAAQVGHSTP